MLKTSIILAMNGRMPTDLKSKGLAKDLPTAKWLFALMGWPDENGQQYPCLEWEIVRTDWPEGDLYYPCDGRKLFVLGNPLVMN